MKALRVVYFWGTAMLIGMTLSGQQSSYAVHANFHPSVATELLTKSYFIRPKGHWDNEFNTYSSLLAHTAKVAIRLIESRQITMDERSRSTSFANRFAVELKDIKTVVSNSFISFLPIDLTGYEYTLISVDKGEWKQRGRIYENRIDIREMKDGPYLLILHDHGGAYFSCQIEIIETHQ